MEKSRSAALELRSASSATLGYARLRSATLGYTRLAPHYAPPPRLTQFICPLSSPPTRYERIIQFYSPTLSRHGFFFSFFLTSTPE